jgi:polysaccharide pyruvyl transferase WcaK-like protein
VVPFVSTGRPIIFITGAKTNLAQEDKKQFELMRQRLPELQLAEATSAREWLELLGDGSVLISGRFHHTIAAACLLTPIVCLPSNTMKIEGICSMLGLNAPLPRGAGSCSNAVTRDITQALDGDAPIISSDAWTEILALAERNFDDL